MTCGPPGAANEFFASRGPSGQHLCGYICAPTATPARHVCVPIPAALFFLPRRVLPRPSLCASPDGSKPCCFTAIRTCLRLSGREHHLSDPSLTHPTALSAPRHVPPGLRGLQLRGIRWGVWRQRGAAALPKALPQPRLRDAQRAHLRAPLRRRQLRALGAHEAEPQQLGEAS